MFGINGIIWWLREKYDHYDVEDKTLIDTKDLSGGSQQMMLYYIFTFNFF